MHKDDRWESSHIEYKCCRDHLSKDIWETVSAFSNEEGGRILLGYVKNGDKYVPEGVKNPAQMIDDLTSTAGHKFNFCPVINAEVTESEGKPVIIVEVKEALKYQKPIFIADAGPLKGGFKRIGASDIRLKDKDIAWADYYRERMGAPDSQPAEGTSIHDIDERAFLAFRELRKLEKPDAPELAFDNSGILKAYDLCAKDQETLTIAGLLLFGRKQPIQRHFPAMRLDIIRIKGTEWGKDRD